MFAAIASFAQSSPDTPTPPPHHEKGGMDHAQMAKKMQEHMEKHMTQLHDKLKLSAAQEPAWKTFTTAMMPTDMPKHEDRKDMEKLTTPERMEKMLAKMQDHQQKMQARLSALKTFYAVLTPEQQKTFDESHRQMMHKMGEKMKNGMRKGMQKGMQDDHMHEHGMPEKS